MLAVRLNDRYDAVTRQINEEVRQPGLSVRVQMNLGLLNQVNPASAHQEPLHKYWKDL